MSDQSVDTKKGLGCILLFLSPFFVSGVGMLFLGVRDYLTEREFTEEIIAELGVGGMFTLISSAFLALILYGYRKNSEEESLKVQFPDEPWKWQQDWLEGRVRSSTPVAVFVYWLFGVTFGAAGVLILFKFNEIRESGPLGYIALIFPLVGFGMIASAVYATLRWRKYGRVACTLVTNPGVIGGWVQAIIFARINMQPGEVVNAQLTCYHRYTTGSGDDKNTHRNVKWQEDMSIEQDRMLVQPDGTLAIPIKVYVPRDCTPTTPGAPSDRHEWELSAEAEVSGIDFQSNFIIPLFVTSESSDTVPANVDALGIGTGDQPYEPSIQVQKGPGYVEIVAPPRRNPQVLFSLTLFWLIWTGVIVGMVYSGDVPWLFPIVFGLFDVFITWGALWSWFGRAELRFEHDSVTIRKTILGYGMSRTLALSSISDVDLHINMQSGNTPYYSMRLHSEGSRHTAFGGMRNKDEAEDIVQTINEILTSKA